MALADYDGFTLTDSDGATVGSIAQTYVDESDEPRFVDVALTGEHSGHRLVPLDWSDVGDNTIAVSFDSAFILGSPQIGRTGDVLTDQALASIRKYYGQARTDQTETRDNAEQEQIGSVATVNEEDDEDEAPVREPNLVARDFGDVIEVPVVEEVLVKKPVVKEVIRVRKNVTTEQHVARGEIRREDVEVEELKGGDSSDTE